MNSMLVMFVTLDDMQKALAFDLETCSSMFIDIRAWLESE